VPPTQVQAIFKIASSNELPAIPDSLSPEAAEFVMLCLQRDPASRPSAQQLLQHSWMHFSNEELAQIPALAVAQPAAAEPAAATWASRGGPCQACGATGPCTCSRATSARMARRSSSSRRRSKQQQQQQARQQGGAGGSLPGATASHLEQQAGAGGSLPAVTSDTASQLEALLLGNSSTARRPAAAGTDSEGQPDEPVLPSAFKASAVLVLPPVRMPQGQLLPPVQVISHHMHLARQHSGTSTISSLLG
jgi:serine/threonine protein kinase